MFFRSSFAKTTDFSYNGNRKKSGGTGQQMTEKELLEAMIENQKSRINEQGEFIKSLQTTIENLTQTVANLEETIAEFKRSFFGVSSEATKAPVVEDAKEPAQGKAIQVKEHIRKKKPKATREELFADLPIEKIVCPVPDEYRHCDWCNAEMVPMNPTFVREEIRVTPAKVTRVHYYQEVLMCPECHKDQDGVFQKGIVPPALFPHSPASASSVTYVMFSKIFMGLPYYRQEKMFKQLGAAISREMMANWCIMAVQDYLLPVYDRLHEELLKREILHADETVCQVLREEGKTPQSTSYMWIYRTGSDGLPSIVMYNYQPGRGGVYPQQFLEGFVGLLQVDGYQGYNKVADVILICCMAHCRRKFFEALTPEKRKSLKLLDINSSEAIKEPVIPETGLEKYIPAEIGVAYCNKLFYLERQLKELSPEERKEKRLEQEVPILENFFHWIESLNPTKGSKLEKAVNYTQNHRDSLCAYLKDGRAELSNNAVERMAKSYAVTRKASLFHTSVAGANACAVLYSLVETAKANNLNVFQYIYFLMLYMPGLKSGSAGIDQLLPWSEFIREHCSRLIDVEKVTVENKPTLTF